MVPVSITSNDPLSYISRFQRQTQSSGLSATSEFLVIILIPATLRVLLWVLSYVVDNDVV